MTDDKDKPAVCNGGSHERSVPPVATGSLGESAHADRRGMLSGLRVVSLCTLLSRVLGMARDMAMAALFGAGPIMDAFTVAFRIPNLARRMFGEGALTAAFLPVFVRELEQGDRESAWRVGTAVLATLAVGLTLLLIVAEAVLIALLRWVPLSAEAHLLFGLLAVVLPYVLFICMAAQVCAMLHSLRHFFWPAMLPVILNIVWLSVIGIVTWSLDSSIARIYWISAGVTVAGVAQLIAAWVALSQFGYRIRPDWPRAMPQVRAILLTMLPVLAGVAITQVNTMFDSVLAWGLSAPEAMPGSEVVSRVWWPTPLESGTASALYFGQRMYQFPLGVFGVALGTVLFPLLSRHAEREEWDRMREDLTYGLRLVISIGLPSGVGLILLAAPITDLLFRHGAFDAGDAAMTTQMIAAYAVGVVAYIALIVLMRGFYAVGDTQTPVRIGVEGVVVNVLLNLLLVWSMGGVGLALGTAVTSTFQSVISVVRLQRRVGRLAWREVGLTTLRTVAAVLAMSAVCYGTLQLANPLDGIAGRLMAVLAPLLAGGLTFLGTAHVLGLREPVSLIRARH